jgi:sugar/nucleoside kinase (ribokinase family)
LINQTPEQIFMPSTDRRSSRVYDLVVIGEINPDIILHGDVVPVFGQVEKNVESGVIRIGSSTVIFACGAAHLGLKVLFLGKVGDDLFGRFMLDAMYDSGIATDRVVVDPNGKTGFSVILSTGDDRAVLTYPGMIPELALRDIDLSLVGQAAHLHLGSYYLLDTLRPDVPAIFAAAHQQQLTISLDTNYDPRERWDSGVDEVLALVDVLFVNATEARGLTGCSQTADALDKLAERVPLVAVKQGAEGAVARQGDAAAWVRALPVKVIDTVGAGDSFDAGFIYGYLAGWSLECCLSLGVCCGSLSTREHGGTAAQPTLEEARMMMPALALC